MKKNSNWMDCQNQNADMDRRDELELHVACGDPYCLDYLRRPIAAYEDACEYEIERLMCY